MNAHNMNGGIFWIVVLKNRFNVYFTAGEAHAKVVMKRPHRPFGALLNHLINRFATLLMVVHGFGDIFRLSPCKYLSIQSSTTSFAVT